jgi:limonene-1,2-epoxide hydrolase
MADLARVGRWSLVALTIVGVIVMGILLASCSSSAPRDFVGNGKAALERTESVALASAQRPRLDMDAAIERFLGLFAEFVRASVERAARDAYAADAYFNDGFVELEGREAIAGYLARTADATADIEVDVEDRVVADGEVYLRWVMRFTTAGSRGRTIVAPGMTHLRFDVDGRIVYHRDYWDGSGALAEFVPLVGPILRQVRARMESG